MAAPERVKLSEKCRAVDGGGGLLGPLNDTGTFCRKSMLRILKITKEGITNDLLIWNREGTLRVGGHSGWAVSGAGRPSILSPGNR